MPKIEQYVMLHSVNDCWMAHLQMIDYIREGIGLRGYGQTDPLIAYKRETHDLFEHTERAIQDQSVRMAYVAQVRREEPEQRQQPKMLRVDGEAARPNGQADPGFNPDTQNWSKVGRNDPCPCGSGKKFKACHYGELRSKGVI